MKCLVKPKGGLYIFGVIFLYLFFAFGPVFETVALIVDGPDNTLEISDFVIMAIFCYLFPVLFIVLHTIEITKYRAEITESDITISSTHFFSGCAVSKEKNYKI